MRCGHRAVWPVPAASELAAIYAGDSYYESGHEGGIGLPNYRRLEVARRRMFERHLRRIATSLRGGTVLDVGCATGEFLALARERGWSILGVDPSSARVDAEVRGVPMVGTTIHDADVPAGTLDLVTFWDVLEHVPDPIADLGRARSLLRPGGLIALTVPDGSSLLSKVTRGAWFGYRTAGEHLQFFTRSSLRLALEASGFRVVEQQPVAWTCSVGFLADRIARYQGVPGRAVAALMKPFEARVLDVPQINQLAIGVRP